MALGSRSVTLAQWGYTIGPFGVLVFAAVFGAIAAPEVDYLRLRAFLWLSLAFATPALAEYAAGEAMLSNWWRQFWTLAAAAYLIHFYYGFWLAFGGDLTDIVAQQSLPVTISNLVLTIAWPADVVWAWVAEPRRSWPRAALHLLIFVSFFLSGVVFHAGVVRLLGAAMTLIVAGALVWGLRRRGAV